MVEMYIPDFTKQHKLLKEAGICNYSIYLCGNDLFGYYECQNGIKYAQDYQNNSEIVKKWNVYMSDILIWDDNKVQGSLDEVFRLD